MEAHSPAPPRSPVSDSLEVSLTELQLAARNHGMPLEALRYDVTPVGLHYLLTHFDIPHVDRSSWRLSIGGHVRSALSLTLDEIRTLPRLTMRVTLECAGNGRARLSPRPVSQPWLNDAVGTAEWTGTPLAPLLRRTGMGDGAVEVVFTGLDRGVQGEVEHAYERSLPVDEALGSDVLLAYAVNGAELPPQHGFPLRLIVPGWYGMTHVKWLDCITVVNEPFEGYQQAVAYRVTAAEEDPGIPVTRMLPRSLMVPPGIPDFLTRRRFLEAGTCVLEGRTWSGWAPITEVHVSADGGESWRRAELEEPASMHGWRRWRFEWDAQPGEHDLCSRAADAAGNLQPVDERWNLQGMTNNAVQRISVVVRPQSR